MESCDLCRVTIRPSGMRIGWIDWARKRWVAVGDGGLDSVYRGVRVPTLGWGSQPSEWGPRLPILGLPVPG